MRIKKKTKYEREIERERMGNKTEYTQKTDRLWRV